MTNLKRSLAIFCVLNANFLSSVRCEHNDINEKENIRKEPPTPYPDTNNATTEEYPRIRYINRFQGFNETDFGRYLQKKTARLVTNTERFPTYVVMHYFHPQKDVIGKSIEIDPNMIVRPKDKQKQKWWCTGKSEPVFLKNGTVICYATYATDTCFVEGVQMSCLKETLSIPDCPQNVVRCHNAMPKHLEIPCLTVVHFKRRDRCAIVIYDKIREPEELSNVEFMWLADNSKAFQKRVESRFLSLLDALLCVVFC